MNPGFTKLIRAERLGRELGMKSLWVKDDSGNPTHSFKDRVVAVALAAARELGFSVLACPSTGNLANAVAAAAARAGIRSVVLVPSNLEQQKILTTAAYGGTLVAVDGTYDDINRLAERDRRGAGGLGVRQRQRPAVLRGGLQDPRLRGRRATRLAAAASRWSSRSRPGAQLVKVDKGFTELVELGLVDARPYRVYGAQATGCSPVSAAFKSGADTVRPVRPDTIAKSLAIGNPADGPYVLDVARRTGGAVEDVSDDEVVDGIRLLARTEGIFAETAGGVTVAVLRKLLATGQLDAAAETVVFNTGDGLKTLDAIAGVVGPTATIAPTLDAFEQAGLA